MVGGQIFAERRSFQEKAGQEAALASKARLLRASCDQ
jgi:hypothetical protein